MNNFEIIARVLSQDNADINELKTEQTKLKTEQTKLKTKITSKEDSFIKLNTDALAGQIFGSETPINLEQNIVLNLFNASSTEELYSQIRSYDNKTFVLKPNGNSFTVDGIQYIITACNPCIGKIYDYNSIPVLCLTFLIDTFNSQTALFKFFISANSNTEISGKLTVENFNKEFEAKQDTLVSGTNIKTINGKSIVGSGDIISGCYPEAIHGKNDTTFTLTPNTFHVWGQVPSLTLDFGSKIRGASNEYLFQFISGPTATLLTLPNNIKWVNNSVPTIKPNMVYQVSILRGLASILEFSSDMYFDFSNYLTIEALEDNLTVTFTNDIEYIIDDNSWVKLNAGDETPPINLGQTFSFRGELVPEQINGIGTFTISKRCNLKGNCMSMLFGDNAADNFSLSGKDYAFYKLFQNCTNIVNVDSSFLSATTLANYCYKEMFTGCKSLTTAPELPAITLTRECYRGMFGGCSSLTTAPELPATALADSCYCYMFTGCTSLTTAPELPAITLIIGCYRGMFGSCSSLTTAPELPATILAKYCYNNMFNSCSKLNYIKMLATDISATDCLNVWVAGVSSTGTFIKNAAMESLPTGSSGIPDGWTVQNA